MLINLKWMSTSLKVQSDDGHLTGSLKKEQRPAATSLK
jgi:hypothetical protein